MRTFPLRHLLLVWTLFLFSTICNATIYNAVSSGNFNSASTWGGVIPGTTVNGDTINIPAGVQVILTTNETFTGTSYLSIASTGSLVSSSNTTALILSSGHFNKAGVIDVDSLVISPSAILVGGFKCKKLTSYGNNVSAVNISVTKNIHLLGGNLSILSTGYLMFVGNNIEVAGGSIIQSGGTISYPAYYDVVYNTGSSITGAELQSNVVRKVSINVSGSVTLSNDLSLADTLFLNSGTLNLNGHNLSLNYDNILLKNAELIISTGNIAATGSSIISIATQNGLHNPLQFATGKDTLGDLILNMSSSAGGVKLNSDMVLTGRLALAKGHLDIGGNKIFVVDKDSISGGSANSYIITSGAGTFGTYLSAGDSIVFPIGTIYNYAPITLRDATGTVSNEVAARVTDAVNKNGVSGVRLSDSQPVVSATWWLSSSNVVGINYDIQPTWNSNMEVNGFNRNHAYISHFTTEWDSVSLSIPLQVGSMYSTIRKGLFSLGGFSIADTAARLRDASNSVRHISTDYPTITISPNPVIDNFNVFYALTGESNIHAEISVVDVTGRKLVDDISVREKSGIINVKLPQNTNPGLAICYLSVDGRVIGEKKVLISQ